MKEEMRPGQEFLKNETVAEMETNQEKLDARIDAINQILRSFEIFSSPGWISIRRGQCPLKKNRKSRWKSRKDGVHKTFHPVRVAETIKRRVEVFLSCVDQKTR
jgi:hypothetical protein